MNRKSLLGKLAGYRSAASQARMRAVACEWAGQVEEAMKWREKERSWLEKAAEVDRMLKPD